MKACIKLGGSYDQEDIIISQSFEIYLAVSNILILEFIWALSK